MCSSWAGRRAEPHEIGASTRFQIGQKVAWRRPFNNSCPAVSKQSWLLSTICSYCLGLAACCSLLLLCSFSVQFLCAVSLCSFSMQSLFKAAHWARCSNWPLVCTCLQNEKSSFSHQTASQLAGALSWAAAVGPITERKRERAEKDFLLLLSLNYFSSPLVQ